MSITKTITIATLLGLSSIASASNINLTGDVRVEGFNPAYDSDLNPHTYSLQLTNISGNVFLDSTPITGQNTSLTLSSIATSPLSAGVSNAFLALINEGFNALPPSVIGIPLNFDLGFPGSLTRTVNNITIPDTGGVNFSEITVTGSGNTLDIQFTESTSIGLNFLLFADATIATDQNNGSLSSAFDLQSHSVSAVPVPAAVWLMGSGFLGLLGFSRKKSA